MNDAQAQQAARSIILESAGPAYLVDAEGFIRAWNTAASAFFGIPAWLASAQPCHHVLRCSAAERQCPLRGDCRSATFEVCFGLRGVAATRVRHTPVLDAEGDLAAVVHELMPEGQETT